MRSIEHKQIQVILWTFFQSMTKEWAQGDKAVAAAFLLASVMASNDLRPGSTDEDFLTDAIPLIVRQCKEIREHLKKHG